MINESPFILTISRTKGSGGTYIGKLIANKLNIPYIDRFNIHLNNSQYFLDDEASNYINIDYCPSTRDPIIRSLSNLSLDYRNYTLADSHNANARIIREIARTTTAVIVGCGADYILQDDVRSLNVFLYSDFETRVDRVRLQCDISAEKAREIVLASDNNRRQFYYNQFGIYWPDVHQYDLSINTGGMKLETVSDVIAVALIEKFQMEGFVPVYND